jgi:urea transport system permease protein
MRLLIAILLCFFVLPLYSADKVETGNETLNEAFEVLLGRNFDAKEQAIKNLAHSGHEKSFELIEGILEGNLRLHKKSKRLVWIEKDGREYKAIDALNQNELGLFKKRKFKKFSINNSLRRYINNILAIQNLTSSDTDVRLAAVQAMLNNPKPEHIPLIEPLISKETDAAVKENMQLIINLASLGSDDNEERLKAITQVSGSLHPAARNALVKLLNSDDKTIKQAAEKAIKKIDERVEFYGQVETLFFGISAGSVLVLAAIGLAITFGVMGVINMAHGELIMLGAYTTYLIQQALPGYTTLSLILAIPAAFMVSGLVGIAIERGVIRFLYGRPLETLLATFGISLMLQQMVRTLISPQNVPVSNPDFMSGFIQINSVLSLTYNRLYIILFCLAVFTALFVILKRTRLGLQVRAVSQNRSMARAMGVRSARVDALTFGLGSGIAGVAGVALSQLTNVGPNLGQSYIVDSFMVVVFGGVGNLWGTLVGGLGLGIANKIMEPWAGAVMAKILILVIVILFIQKRPRGLFPQKGRAVEN